VTHAEEILKKYQIKAYINQADAHLLDFDDELINTFSGDRTEVLAGLVVNLIHAPGHSQGSIYVKIGGVVFTGDTLFPGAIGRTDLPGSDSEQMRKSLKKLAGIPHSTVVYAGHAYGASDSSMTTIGDELKTNPFLKFGENKLLGDLV
jgi:glyoxylase-like metal-dependent hydrolase (beta-lactamase superfamily II)